MTAEQQKIPSVESLIRKPIVTTQIVPLRVTESSTNPEVSSEDVKKYVEQRLSDIHDFVEQKIQQPLLEVIKEIGTVLKDLVVEQDKYRRKVEIIFQEFAKIENIFTECKKCDKSKNPEDGIGCIPTTIPSAKTTNKEQLDFFHEILKEVFLGKDSFQHFLGNACTASLGLSKRLFNNLKKSEEKLDNEPLSTYLDKQLGIIRTEKNSEGKDIEITVFDERMAKIKENSDNISKYTAFCSCPQIDIQKLVPLNQFLDFLNKYPELSLTLEKIWNSSLSIAEKIDRIDMHRQKGTFEEHLQRIKQLKEAKQNLEAAIFFLAKNLQVESIVSTQEQTFQKIEKQMPLSLTPQDPKQVKNELHQTLKETLGKTLHSIVEVSLSAAENTLDAAETEILVETPVKAIQLLIEKGPTQVAQSLDQRQLDKLINNLQTLLPDESLNIKNLRQKETDAFTQTEKEEDDDERLGTVIAKLIIVRGVRKKTEEIIGEDTLAA